MAKKNAETLMGGETSGYNYEHRQKLLSHDQIVSEQNDDLKKARIVMNDARQVGNGTIVQLKENTEKIYSINDKVGKSETGGHHELSSW